MRDARNLEDLEIKVGERTGRVDSFWITEAKEIFIKVNYGDMVVNYPVKDLHKFEVGQLYKSK
jgi:hypothetical protein